MLCNNALGDYAEARPPHARVAKGDLERWDFGWAKPLRQVTDGRGLFLIYIWETPIESQILIIFF